MLCGVLTREARPVFRPEGIPETPVIVIDAGHGGEDGGAVAADGTVESGINLAIAQDLDALLRLLGCETKLRARRIPPSTQRALKRCGRKKPPISETARRW